MYCVSDFLLLCGGTTAAEEALHTMGGIVVNMDFTRDTFNVCPTDDGCPVTEENVFVVTVDTKMDGIRSFGELRVEDEIQITGKPFNEVVWIARKIGRS